MQLRHVAVKIKQLRTEREKSFVSILEELSAKQLLHSSYLITRLYEDSRSEIDTLNLEVWNILKMPLENIGTKSELDLEIKRIKKELKRIVSWEYRKIVKEVIGICKGRGLNDNVVDLKRERLKYGEYVKCRIMDSEITIENFRYERLKRINEDELQDKSLSVINKQAWASWVSALAAIILLLVTCYNTFQMSKATKLAVDANKMTNDYVNATVEQVALGKKQYDFMFTQWQRENMPSIIVDYVIHRYDSNNVMTSIYIKNLGKGICNNLDYSIDFPNKKGTIQKLYNGQEVVILSGNFGDILKKMKNGFKISTSYLYAGEKIKQIFEIQLDFNRRKQADLNDIYNALNSISKEFESNGGQENRNNISGRLYDINKSLENIAEKK